MSRRRPLSPFNLAFSFSMLALAACDESTNPTGPEEPASLAAAAAASYSAHDLAIPDAGELATATGINTAGHVVGFKLRPDDALRGFIWKNGVATDLGTLGGRQTSAMDINDAGQVVGFSERPTGVKRAFRWMNGTMTALGTLGGRESRAFAINKSGHVVGQSQLAGNTESHAFLLKNGVMTDLGTLGGRNSAAMDINDAGQVVGWSETANGTRHPFLWENGVMKDLFQPGSTSTGTAYAISPLGTVVGERNNRAFRWTNGVISGLGQASRSPSVATDIRGGRIVGYFTTAPTRAFVFAGGEVTLLPLLPGGTDSEAHAVNGAGVIVGGTTKESSGNDHVTRWTRQ